MKNLILLFFVILFLQNCKPERETESRPEVEEEEIKCERIKKAPLAPFSFESEIKKVQLVAYDSSRGFTDIPIIKDSSLVFKAFKEIVVLKKGELDSLKSILQEYPPEGVYVSAECYLPHHCFHFLDKNDKVLAYLEICFDYHDIRASSPELRLSCEEQFPALEKFMKQCGITHSFPEKH